MNKAVAEGKATVRDGCVAHILDAMHGERKGSVSAPNMSATAIADELNRWRVATPTKDARRYAQSVIRVLARLDRAAANISPSVNPIASTLRGRPPNASIQNSPSRSLTQQGFFAVRRPQ